MAGLNENFVDAGDGENANFSDAENDGEILGKYFDAFFTRLRIFWGELLTYQPINFLLELFFLLLELFFLLLDLLMLLHGYFKKTPTVRVAWIFDDFFIEIILSLYFLERW